MKNSGRLATVENRTVDSFERISFDNPLVIKFFAILAEIRSQVEEHRSLTGYACIMIRTPFSYNGVICRHMKHDIS